MIGIELVEDQQTKIPNKKLMRKFIITALRKGLMVCASWDFQTIVIMPPLCLSQEEVYEGLDKIKMVLKEISPCHEPVESISLLPAHVK
ncbi:MAG TPA: hypothetical protein VGQ09_13240 [Chitinophagaceae bacterium]|nr:hypothetical protein [Chitinophagaceae bacterium]